MERVKKHWRVVAALTALLALIAFPVLADTFARIVDNATAVSAPQIVTVTSTAVSTVFSLNPSLGVGRPILRTVQNTGTQPVLYLINSTNVSTTSYHGVLAAGQANRDGLGTVLDLSKVPFPVSFITESGSTTIAVVEEIQ